MNQDLSCALVEFLRPKPQSLAETHGFLMLAHYVNTFAKIGSPLALAINMFVVLNQAVLWHREVISHEKETTSIFLLCDLD